MTGRRPVLAALAALVLCAAPRPGAPQPAALSRAEVRAIVAQLRADPDLKSTELTHVPRWVRDRDHADDAPPSGSGLERLLRWLFHAFEWIGAGARWLVWIAGALAVALLAVSIRRWSRERADPGVAIAMNAPAQVGALDVRPQSLPQDIGAAARALWMKGSRREALSLLYRGALSRLIHRYQVPIRAAHTEGECLRLARGRLGEDQGAFFARLVGTWQLAVYAAREPEADGVLALCDEFERVLPPAPAQAQAQRP
jgi:hypothetical protein